MKIEVGGEIVEVPDWAKWIARDKNGAVFVFEDKPHLRTDGDEWLSGAGTWRQIDAQHEPIIPWTETLRQVAPVDSPEAISDSLPASSRQVGGDHYKTMGIQTWDVVDTWPLEQKIGYYRGSALKYIMRMGRKDAEVQEIEKGIHYLEKLVEVLKEQAA